MPTLVLVVEVLETGFLHYVCIRYRLLLFEVKSTPNCCAVFLHNLMICDTNSLNSLLHQIFSPHNYLVFR